MTIDAMLLSDRQLPPDILYILEKLRPEWLPENIQTKVFTGGISNHLYGYYEEGKFQKDVVLFRIDAEGKELMVDKNREKQNMQTLHTAGCGPPLYAAFNNGLAYGYIHGHVLDQVTVREEKVRKLIITEISRLHAIRPEGLAPNVDTWKTFCFRLLELSPEGFPDNSDKHKRYIELIQSKSQLQDELKGLWHHLETLDSPVVYCHNDINPQNIIYNEDRGSVHFIDYEFAMYNYEHYEIASHFCESGADDAGFIKFPEKSYQLDWMRYYLQCKAEQNGGSADDVTDRDVEECYVKTNKFALVRHFNSPFFYVFY